jgi:hypothetical protein
VSRIVGFSIVTYHSLSKNRAAPTVGNRCLVSLPRVLIIAAVEVLAGDTIGSSRDKTLFDS